MDQPHLLDLDDTSLGAEVLLPEQLPDVTGQSAVDLVEEVTEVDELPQVEKVQEEREEERHQGHEGEEGAAEGVELHGHEEGEEEGHHAHEEGEEGDEEAALLPIGKSANGSTRQEGTSISRLVGAGGPNDQVKGVAEQGAAGLAEQEEVVDGSRHGGLAGRAKEASTLGGVSGREQVLPGAEAVVVGGEEGGDEEGIEEEERLAASEIMHKVAAAKSDMVNLGHDEELVKVTEGSDSAPGLVAAAGEQGGVVRQDGAKGAKAEEKGRGMGKQEGTDGGESGAAPGGERETGLGAADKAGGTPVQLQEVTARGTRKAADGGIAAAGGLDGASVGSLSAGAGRLAEEEVGGGAHDASIAGDVSGQSDGAVPAKGVVSGGGTKGEAGANHAGKDNAITGGDITSQSDSRAAAAPSGAPSEGSAAAVPGTLAAGAALPGPGSRVVIPPVGLLSVMKELQERHVAAAGQARGGAVVAGDDVVSGGASGDVVASGTGDGPGVVEAEDRFQQPAVTNGGKQAAMTNGGRKGVSAVTAASAGGGVDGKPAVASGVVDSPSPSALASSPKDDEAVSGAEGQGSADTSPASSSGPGAPNQAVAASGSVADATVGESVAASQGGAAGSGQNGARGDGGSSSPTGDKKKFMLEPARDFEGLGHGSRQRERELGQRSRRQDSAPVGGQADVPADVLANVLAVQETAATGAGGAESGSTQADGSVSSDAAGMVTSAASSAPPPPSEAFLRALERLAARGQRVQTYRSGERGSSANRTAGMSVWGRRQGAGRAASRSGGGATPGGLVPEGAAKGGDAEGGLGMGAGRASKDKAAVVATGSSLPTGSADGGGSTPMVAMEGGVPAVTTGIPGGKSVDGGATPEPGLAGGLGSAGGAVTGTGTSAMPVSSLPVPVVVQGEVAAAMTDAGATAADGGKAPAASSGQGATKRVSEGAGVPAGDAVAGSAAGSTGKGSMPADALAMPSDQGGAREGRSSGSSPLARASEQGVLSHGVAQAEGKEQGSASTGGSISGTTPATNAADVTRSTPGHVSDSQEQPSTRPGAATVIAASSSSSAAAAQAGSSDDSSSDEVPSGQGSVPAGGSKGAEQGKDRQGEGGQGWGGQGEGQALGQGQGSGSTAGNSNGASADSGSKQAGLLHNRLRVDARKRGFFHANSAKRGADTVESSQGGPVSAAATVQGAGGSIETKEGAYDQDASLAASKDGSSPIGNDGSALFDKAGSSLTDKAGLLSTVEKPSSSAIEGASSSTTTEGGASSASTEGVASSLSGGEGASSSSISGVPKDASASPSGASGAVITGQTTLEQKAPAKATATAQEADDKATTATPETLTKAASTPQEAQGKATPAGQEQPKVTPAEMMRERIAAMRARRGQGRASSVPQVRAAAGEQGRAGISQQGANNLGEEAVDVPLVSKASAAVAGTDEKADSGVTAAAASQPGVTTLAGTQGAVPGGRLAQDAGGDDVGGQRTEGSVGATTVDGVSSCYQGGHAGPRDHRADGHHRRPTGRDDRPSTRASWARTCSRAMQATSIPPPPSPPSYRSWKTSASRHLIGIAAAAPSSSGASTFSRGRPQTLFSTSSVASSWGTWSCKEPHSLQRCPPPAPLTGQGWPPASAPHLQQHRSPSPGFLSARSRQTPPDRLTMP
eukprot:jgi/Mesvir1/4419/Mv11914-RA.1